jgi:hypothetical protein
MRYKKNRRNVLFLTLLVFGMMSVLGSANAMRFNPGEDTIVDCDVTVKYGGGWRVSDQEDDKLLNPNNDDGNRNFDQWSMINNKATIIADIDIQHKNFGVFIRPKAFYDHAYISDNDNDSPLTNNALLGNIINDNDEWADEVEDVHGKDAEILDLFGYLSFDLGGHLTEIRVGRQTIAWGEQLYISGGVASGMSYADLSAAVAVGTELKEIYLPSESVFLQVEITNAMAFAAFYQWKWEPHRLYEGGTFFATSPVGDLLDELEAPLITQFGLFGRGDDLDADDSGQFGVALTYVLPWLNDMEIVLYYVNYHDKSPTFWVAAPQHFLSYTEDIKLYGISYSALVGDVNISGEFSYRDDFIFDTVEEGNYWQAQTSWLYAAAPPIPIAPYYSIGGEISMARTIGRMDDTFAWQYVLALGFDWYQVITDLDVALDFKFAEDCSGTMPTTSMGYTEGEASGSVAVEFLYKNVYKTKIAYENRFNEKRNANSDRDTLTLAVSYTF